MEKSQSTEIDNNIYKENPTPAKYIYNLSIIIKWVGITPSLTDNLSKKKKLWDSQNKPFYTGITASMEDIWRNKEN